MNSARIDSQDLLSSKIFAYYDRVALGSDAMLLNLSAGLEKRLICRPIFSKYSLTKLGGPLKIV